MKLLSDLFPIIVFFVVYKFFGIYYATGAAMVVALLQMLVIWLRHKHIDKMLVMSTIIIVVLGGATLLLHDAMFIKWKPSVINWAFGLVFLGSHFIGEKPIMQRILDEQVSLPDFVWKRINAAWALFFIVMGFLNIYVVYHFSTNAWVNFKLFGVLGITLLFAIGQSIYMMRHVKPEDE